MHDEQIVSICIETNTRFYEIAVQAHEDRFTVARHISYRSKDQRNIAYFIEVVTNTTSLREQKSVYFCSRNIVFLGKARKPFFLRKKKGFRNLLPLQ